MPFVVLGKPVVVLGELAARDICTEVYTTSNPWHGKPVVVLGEVAARDICTEVYTTGNPWHGNHCWYGDHCRKLKSNHRKHSKHLDRRLHPGNADWRRSHCQHGVHCKKREKGQCSSFHPPPIAYDHAFLSC